MPLRLVLLILLVFSLCAPAPCRDEIHLATVSTHYRSGLEEIARRYEALHPEVKIRISFIARDYATWIRAQFAGGERVAPDIFHPNFTFGYIQSGRIEPLNAELATVNPYTGRIWNESFDMQLFNRDSVGGKYYAIVLDRSETGLLINMDIFRKAGVDPPETWEELLEACRAIQRVGITPVAMGGDVESFWVGSVGVLVMAMGDVFLRDLSPMMMSRSGDADYSGSSVQEILPSSTDPYWDATISLNEERRIRAVRDGDIQFNGERFRAMYKLLREFSAYWSPGYMGMDYRTAYSSFLRGQAAMLFCSSIAISELDRDLCSLPESQRFNWKIIPFPTIAHDPLARGPFRSIGGSSTTFGVTNKSDRAHVARGIDFLKYLTASENMQVLVDLAVKERQTLPGPIVVKGVQLPAEYEKQYAAFNGLGYLKIEFRGLLDEQESVFDWTVLAQEYFAGRMELDQFLELYQAAMLRAAERVAQNNHHDLDPATPSSPPEQDRSHRPDPWDLMKSGTAPVILLAMMFISFVLTGCMLHRRRSPAGRPITAYLLVAPTFALLVVFNYYPALSGLLHAFTSWEETRQARFVGLDNFRHMLSDHILLKGIGNQLFVLGAAMFKATVIPFAVAEMLMALRSPRVRRFFRLGFLLPIATPSMVGVLIWRFVYDPNIGLLNSLLSMVGLEELRRAWLGDLNLALPSIIMMGFPWVGALGLLIYLAALGNINVSILDSAKIECLSVIQRIRHIDIPLVRNQTRLLIILTIISSLQDFSTILIMTNGGPGLATMVPALRMYHAAFRFSHYGYGAAIGFVLFLVMLLIAVGINRFAKTETE